MTVAQLAALLNAQVEKGNGDNPVMVQYDAEGLSIYEAEVRSTRIYPDQFTLSTEGVSPA